MHAWHEDTVGRKPEVVREASQARYSIPPYPIINVSTGSSAENQSWSQQHDRYATLPSGQSDAESADRSAASLTYKLISWISGQSSGWSGGVVEWVEWGEVGCMVHKTVRSPNNGRANSGSIPETIKPIPQGACHPENRCRLINIPLERHKVVKRPRVQHARTSREHWPTSSRPWKNLKQTQLMAHRLTCDIAYESSVCLLPLPFLIMLKQICPSFKSWYVDA